MKKCVMLGMLVILLFFLYGCSGNHKNNKDLKTKVGEELEYLDKNLIYLLNKLNNISFENYSVSSEKVTLGETSQSTVEQTGEGGGESAGSSGQSGGSEGSSGSISQTGGSRVGRKSRSRQ